MFANRAERPDPDRGIASFLYTMYRGGMTNPFDIARFMIPENTPWGKFLLETFSLDKQNQLPQGSHWFSMFCILKNQGKIARFDISAIQEILHDSHFHKKGLTHLHSYMDAPIEDLIRELGNPTTIEVIDLSNLSFDKIVDFSQLIFPIDVSFENTKFLKDVHFNKTAFYKKANFNGTQFRAEADFTRARFCRNANFRDANFQNHATFMSAIFAGTRTTSLSNNPSFTNVTFSGDANFRNVTFSDPADFSNINFTNGGYFAESKFSSAAYFSNSKFFRRTDFYKVKFLNGVWFPNAIFFGNVRFDEAMFNNIVIFADTEFFDNAKFDKVKITGHTNFRNAKFKKYVPNFYKAELYSDISWDGARWPKPNRKTRLEVVPQNKNAYENLGSHMKSLDKHDDQHFFYRQETRCQRQLERSVISPFYWFYEIFANYGYGIERALFWWFSHILLGAFLIRATTEKSCNNVCDLANNYLLDLAVSFANAHGVLFFSNGPLKDCYKHFEKDDIFNIIWASQTVFGAIFLFLLLTTLRVRFRLK